jgi:ABC-type multidrug transport system ATPase subunit/predicted component of type VI protein secretion system/ABC-type transport system involved in multi-copper enzyme maturation permease subunit
MNIVLKSSLRELNQIRIEEHQKLTIGRSLSNSIVLDSPRVSADHIRVFWRGGVPYIVDLGSSNGTFMGGDKLEPNRPYQLREREIIIMGSEDASFEVASIGGEQGTQMFKADNKVYIVGRNPSSDIYINAPIISSSHLKIEKRANRWYFYDDGSTNGTFLNNQHNLVQSDELRRGDILYLGNYKLQADRILQFLEEQSSPKSENLKLSKEIITMGRDPKSDIYINHPSASFHHAKLTKTAKGYKIRDLDSTNGTYVNGIEVKRETIVKQGDEISLGIHNFILSMDESQKPIIKKRRTIDGDGFYIEAKNITVIKKDKETGGPKTLLQNISFTVNPGEFVGLMGLSGAGKTTLLKVLNGYDTPTKGTSLINNLELSNSYDVLKTTIGYVPQDDILHPELTVQEELWYYAKLRLPSDTTNYEINSKIDEILNKLGLNGTQGTLIGSPEKKGISGGQKKRVSLAMELLATPKVIFLDEPTSGLSAVDTKMVMKQLKELTESGITIIITIHQPSIDNYKFMDNLIILSNGKLAYYGRTFPDSIEYFNPNCSEEILENPDNALIGLDNAEKRAGEDKKGQNKKGSYWQKRYRNSKEYKEFVEKRKGKKSKRKLSAKSTSGLSQWLTLTSRYLKIKLKDITNTSILLAQAPLIAIMIAMLFSKTDYVNMPVTLFFVLAISAIWFGTINASREIVSEKAIFERERMVGVKLLPYLMSKFLILSILCALQSVALVVIVELMLPLGFQDALWEVILLVFLTSLGGLSIGLLVSTLAKSQAQALGLIPLVLLPMIIFGGGMLSIKQMSENSNKFAYYMSQGTPTKWALEEITRIYVDKANEEEDCKNNTQIVWKGEKNRINIGESCDDVYKKGSEQGMECYENFTRCVMSRDFIEVNYGDKKTETELIYIMLGIFILFPLIIVLIILKSRDNQ